MPPRKVIAILDGAFAKLKVGGAFYQFTYGPRCPVDRKVLDRLGLVAERIGGTFANLPPAAVYRIRRDDAAAIRLPEMLAAGGGRKSAPFVSGDFG